VKTLMSLETAIVAISTLKIFERLVYAIDAVEFELICVAL
jgi:hypothetical protein